VPGVDLAAISADFGPACGPEPSISRILLIEDDDALSAVLAATLRDAGHVVQQAANGRDGMKLFKAAPADVIITDLIMPEQEGIETITAIRKQHPKLPIIAISGALMHATAYLQAAEKLGASRSLAKPFSSAQLLQLVAEVLAEQEGPGAA
jgi:DNA-binding NtrC family response regulator